MLEVLSRFQLELENGSILSNVSWFDTGRIILPISLDLLVGRLVTDRETKSNQSKRSPMITNSVVASYEGESCKKLCLLATLSRTVTPEYLSPPHSRSATAAAHSTRSFLSTSPKRLRQRKTLSPPSSRNHHPHQNHFCIVAVPHH